MKELQSEIQRLMKIFGGSFINDNNELILIPRTNLYFCLGNVGTVLDLKCKVIVWCSRDASKSMPYHSHWHNEQYQEKVRDKINSFLGTSFDKGEWLLIYSYLGNDIRRELCEEFVNSGYDLKVIMEGK